MNIADTTRSGQGYGSAITPRRAPRVLSIAGTDPTGGAGQQADLKTITALGGYGMSVITAVVAQNTRGVRSIHVPPLEVLTAQLEAVSDDVTVDAVKIGMLGSVPVIHTVQQWLSANRPPVVVLDPVMIATAGGRLLDDDAESAMREMVHLADLVTPNLPEMAVLLDVEEATSWSQALAQGQQLADIYQVRVLVKGGHLAGERTPDALMVPGARSPDFQASAPKIHTRNTHGTGCTLSTAVAVLAARTGDWASSVAVARNWLRGAIRQADRLEVGGGNGPVHHGYHLADLVDRMAQAQAVTDEDGSHAFTEAAAAASFTQSLWDQTADVRDRIQAGAFVTLLADGSMPQDVFLDYLAQDLLYLQDYSVALCQLAVRAPQEQWRAFLAEGAAGCARETAQLHTTLVDARADVSASRVTSEYTEFLLATTQSRDWAVGATAVLPCYWLYAWIGEQLAQQAGDVSGSTHPYAAWINAYSDPVFTDAAQRARSVVDQVAHGASPQVQEQMRTAFRRACELEERFFRDPCTRGGVQQSPVGT